MRAVLRLSIAVILHACASEKPSQVGVNVYSDDTIPVAFTVEPRGGILIGIQADDYSMRPDKSLLMMTPATLVVNQGDGGAMITRVSGGKRMAVQPFFGSPDSTNEEAVAGTAVLMRVDAAKNLRLELRSP